jgi:hypothetical protein
MKLPKPDQSLETKLGIYEAAEKCNIWDKRAIYYVYLFVDPLQIDVPKIYVGMGQGGRRLRHWDNSHSNILKEFINLWKVSGLDIDDVSKVLQRDLSQREAACLETYLISKHNPEANIRYYWTPDLRTEHSEDDRRHYSQKMLGRSQPKDGIEKSSKSRTNNHTLELHFGGQRIRTFTNTTAVNISNWILAEREVIITPSALWATIKGRKGTNANGYRLIKISKDKAQSLETKLLRAITGKAVAIKNVYGKIRVFVSSAAAAEVLGIKESNLGIKNLGTTAQAFDYTSRHLTEMEISKNIEKWPVYHQITLNSEVYKFLNITKFCNTHNLIIGTIHKLLNGVSDYSVSAGKRVEGSTHWNYKSYEITNLKIFDDLLTPKPKPIAEYQSKIKGVFWEKYKQQWNIVVVLNSETKNLGYTRSKKLAEKVSEFLYNNVHNPDVLIETRALFKSLKRKNGERVKNDDYLLTLGRGKTFLENAAIIGQKIIDKVDEIPSGTKNREKWYKDNYGIPIRVAQRYVQVAYKKAEMPEHFVSANSVTNFLSMKNDKYN